jgi:hypothetical protein
MNLLRAIVKELLAMFVDDGSLALLSLLLVAAVTVLVELAGMPSGWGAAALLLGCAALLAGSVYKGARGAHRRRQ